ncbi:DUF362 domain-containing protein [Dehalobacter sp. DCM]|uniref:DUF362 domain-containing protein n=1 Tax=Dehalobacter sp. DCM TaxID=2907827 RepID=UPI0030816BB3|nr:DUF362 domain-containing protein [Dehalobacter sp. DCM]
MEKVALLKCTDYQVDLIERKIREGFELLGGDSFIRSLIPRNSKVLLKPNFLNVNSKNSPVITHHTVFEAAIRVIKDFTDQISFGDSPGHQDPLRAAEKSGFMEIAQKYHVTYADFNDAVHVELDKPLLYKYWDIARPAYEADVLITLPKLKTHALMYYTGAVKNQFGCVPGTQKAQWHLKQPDPEYFSRILLDINSLVKTKFAILDGIIAMEGNGPLNGNPKQMDTIIMGRSLTAVDSTAVRLIGYKNVLEVPFLKVAQDTLWGTVLPPDIEILGETISTMRCKDFKVCRSSGLVNRILPSMDKFVSRAMAPDPVVIPDLCIGCKQCDVVCPKQNQVISFGKKKEKLLPKWDYNACIRCYCCQELCPQGAIVIKNKPIGKLFRRH